MKYLKYTYISKATGKSVYGNRTYEEVQEPKIKDLELTLINESAFPTFTPELFGTCSDDADTSVEGVLEVMTKESWDAAVQLELDSRFSCPAVLTAKQIRLALLDAGLLEQTETLIKTLPKDLQIAWEYGTEVSRISPLIKQITTNLNLFEYLEYSETTKIDAIFIKGETL